MGHSNRDLIQGLSRPVLLSRRRGRTEDALADAVLKHFGMEDAFRPQDRGTNLLRAVCANAQPAHESGKGR